MAETAGVFHAVTKSTPHQSSASRVQELTVHHHEAPLQAQDLVAGSTFLATAQLQTLEAQM